MGSSCDSEVLLNLNSGKTYSDYEKAVIQGWFVGSEEDYNEIINSGGKGSCLYFEKVLLPELESNEIYIVEVNGLYTPDNIRGIENLLIWLNDNWGSYGYWVVDGRYMVLICHPDHKTNFTIDKKSLGGFSLGFNNGFK